MKPEEILELIMRVDGDEKNIIMLKIFDIGHIELPKDKVIDILYSQYAEARRIEFKLWLEATEGVYGYSIAEELDINTETFSQLLNGHIRSNKKVGTMIDFVTKSKNIAENILSGK